MDFTDKDRQEARLFSLKHLMEQLMGRVGGEADDDQAMGPDGKPMSVEVSGKDPEAITAGLDKAKELLHGMDDADPKDPSEGMDPEDMMDHGSDDAEEDDDSDALKKMWSKRFRR